MSQFYSNYRSHKYAHTNTPDYHFNWQVLLFHCVTAHLEVTAHDYQVFT